MTENEFEATLAIKCAQIEELYAQLCEVKQENERLRDEIQRLKNYFSRCYEEDFNY